MKLPSRNRGPAERPSIRWKEAASLLALAVLIVFFWNTWAVYPLKILVVLFHEMSHGIAAIVTGGRVVSIEIVPEQGGLCTTAGGSRFVVLTAGYLGSLIWGGVILALAARTKWDKAVSMALGILLLLVTVFLVRPVIGFGFGFGLVAGLALAVAGHALPQQANEYLLKVIGLTSCLYAILDIKSDILDHPTLRSDAYMLAEATGLPTLFWGVVWITAALIASGWFVWVSCRSKP